MTMRKSRTATGSRRKFTALAGRFLVEFMDPGGVWRSVNFVDGAEAERTFKAIIAVAIANGYRDPGGCIVVPNMPRLIPPKRVDKSHFRADLE